ncbi:DGQHR domain-containing protein [Paenibacillus sp. HB172176]|uniref:DGQHR domain-containing protein n=1 Tax=Paenibacillus sp. HB172176 TaxID=2493690 RepID=UPI0014388505|nr:DGQHR domain-containing protein [Paenibacillus sp. HB172176]
MVDVGEYTTKVIRNTFGDVEMLTFSMKVKDIVHIYYVAARGRDDEEGAVQRILNKQRIKSIKKFILDGNMFVSSFILNWTDENSQPTYTDEEISIPIIPSAAQVIDGQHRLAGLQEALKDREEIGEKDILVTLSIKLTTKQAAAIFLNINSEQKPVPRSLIYDLYGVVEDNNDHAINRANDIASDLNDNTDSPYYNCVKFPGSPRGVGMIDLSTVVSSLKKHLDFNGTFPNYKLRDLNIQKQVIMNYFTAINYYYEKEGMWSSRTKNPFLQNAGFFGAIEFLTTSLIPKCSNKKSFSIGTMKSFLQLDQNDLLTQKDIKGLDGKTARNKVIDFLETSIRNSIPEQDEYEL